MADTKTPEDIEKIKRVLYLLYNSQYALNLLERTYQSNLGLLKTKLEVIKSEKPYIVFEKAPRTKGMTYISLNLLIRHNNGRNVVSKARVTDEVAAQFAEEIQKDGYAIDTARSGTKYEVYALT